MRDRIGYDERRRRERRVRREVEAIAERACKLVDRAGLKRILAADLRDRIDLAGGARAPERRSEDALRRHVLRLLLERAPVARRQLRRAPDVHPVFEFVGQERAVQRIGRRHERIGIRLARKERDEIVASKILLHRIDRATRAEHRITGALAGCGAARDVRQELESAVVELLLDLLILNEELQPLALVLTES